MKRLSSILLFISIFFGEVQGQRNYVTAGGEMIFSFANINDHGRNDNSLLRWAPVFNFQTMFNSDLSNRIGLFSGLALRNVGYIYDNYTDPVTESVYKKKFRSYNLAVPLGIKVGNLNRMFLYGGYEIELPFLYKEKTFDDGDKMNKITGWFSYREKRLQHGFMAGIQFPYGANLKFKYYLSEFHNRNFVDRTGNKPYEGLKANIFYISLCSYLFKNFNFEVPVRDKSSSRLLNL